ncbi:hypothetical protein [Absidia glauca]|uniref:Uncharacterized protein n=1 Tax=Absidia glauca TaxID=4829 RepID=A0A168SVS2_ABSGL|nr:hypothetical protein [Absidia glauca]
MGITSVAIGALVYFEASHRYNEYREWQEYQRYAHAHTSTRDSAYYDKNNGFDDKNSDDDHDNQDDKHKKAFVRKLQDDDHELRRRPQRPTTGAAETSASTTSDYSGSSNRPVADKEWVDSTDYELNELEKKLAYRKEELEMEQERLNKAEMDLERRRQSLEQRSSDIHDRLNSPSSSSHLSNSLHTISSNDYALSKDTMPKLPTVANTDSRSPSLRMTTAIEEQEEGRSASNKEDDTSLGTSRHSSASFISALPLSSSSAAVAPPSGHSDTRKTTELGSTTDQPHSPKNAIDLKEGNPWAFHDDNDEADDDEDGKVKSMRFPTSSTGTHSNNNNNSDNHSVSNTTGSDCDGSWNDVHSVITTTTSGNDMDPLRSPSLPPSSSSDDHSYDSIHHSDAENGH